MLFEYYYSKNSGIVPRRTLRCNVEYTNCVLHDASDDIRNSTLPEDAILVAIEDVNTITTKEATK